MSIITLDTKYWNSFNYVSMDSVDKRIVTAIFDLAQIHPFGKTYHDINTIYRRTIMSGYPVSRTTVFDRVMKYDKILSPISGERFKVRHKGAWYIKIPSILQELRLDILEYILTSGVTVDTKLVEFPYSPEDRLITIYRGSNRKYFNIIFNYLKHMSVGKNTIVQEDWLIEQMIDICSKANIRKSMKALLSIPHVVIKLPGKKAAYRFNTTNVVNV